MAHEHVTMHIVPVTVVVGMLTRSPHRSESFKSWHIPRILPLHWSNSLQLVYVYHFLEPYLTIRSAERHAKLMNSSSDV